MARATQDLYVFLHGARIGRLVRLRRGAVHLYYEPGRSPLDTPLSLSLPAGYRERHDVSDWVDGILPENPRTRARMARELGAASTAPYDLLCTRAGLECAGAVQFSVRPVLDDPQAETLMKLTDADIAHHLRLITQDAVDDPSEGLGVLRLSLPGAQPKMALRLTGDGWHLPTGSLATTHILKPQRGHLTERLRDSIAVNEHLCQAAAATLGLNAARTSLELFEDEVCLVAERFDREMSRDDVRRVHFEDMCAALGVPTAQKYQQDGGPGPEDVVALLRQENRADTSGFFLSVFFNSLIGNTDGHAKNYGLLLDGSRPRLAPLYDLNSLAPYMHPGQDLSRPAMRFGEPTPTTLGQWEHTAARLGINVGIGTLKDIAEGLPDAFNDAVARCPQWAAETAREVCDRVVAHAAKTAGGGVGMSLMGTRTSTGLDVVEPQVITTCAKTVKRTGKPCLLRAGHGGKCRSVL